jgi:hypothetical protein
MLSSFDLQTVCPVTVSQYVMFVDPCAVCSVFSKISYNNPNTTRTPVLT